MLNQLEVRAASRVCPGFALRMLGLFMLLPVLAVYSEQIPGSTPVLIGVAIERTALVGLLQIPTTVARLSGVSR